MPLYPLYIFLDDCKTDLSDTRSVKSCSITGSVIEGNTLFLTAEIALESSNNRQQQAHATDSLAAAALKNETSVYGKIPAVRFFTKQKKVTDTAFISCVLREYSFPLNLPVFRIANVKFEKATLLGTEAEQWSVISSSWCKISRASEH